MGQILIRNLDDAVIADYQRMAADSGRSLEAELRDLLVKMRPRQRLTAEDKMALSLSLTSRTPPDARAIDSTELIREDRDAR